jgi:hypothetical protein
MSRLSPFSCRCLKGRSSAGVGHSLPEELWPDIVTRMATLADLT